MLFGFIFLYVWLLHDQFMVAECTHNRFLLKNVGNPCTFHATLRYSTTFLMLLQWYYSWYSHGICFLRDQSVFRKCIHVCMILMHKKSQVARITCLLRVLSEVSNCITTERLNIIDINQKRINMSSTLSILNRRMLLILEAVRVTYLSA